MLWVCIVLAFASFCLYICYQFMVSTQEKQQAKALSCKPTFVQRNRLPVGFDHFLRLEKADKAKMLPDEIAQYFAEEGRNTFQTRVFGTLFTQTIDPQNVQAILATQFHDFELGDLRRKALFPLLGSGIFTEDGSRWEHSRAMLRPQFQRNQVSRVDLEEEHVQRLLKLLPTDSSGWTDNVDLVPMFYRLTIEAAVSFLFGADIVSQQEAITACQERTRIGHEQWTDFGKLFDDVTKDLGHRVRLSEFYWLHSPKSFRRSCKVIHDFADFFIQKAIAEHDNEKRHPENVVSETKYVFLKELVKVTRDPIELRSQLVNILLAGRDTTAGLLSWSFWLLSRHPQVFNKLRAEILRDLGQYEDGTAITFEKLKSCKYLQYVLKEVLRLYPSVPVNARTATKNTSLPLGGGLDGRSPMFITKGQEVWYFVYVMHRRKDIWGDDADEFKPERWIDRKSGWEYLPFNGGPRVCLGQQFALTEAGYVITRLLQRFDKIDASRSTSVTVHNFGLTDSPQSCTIRLHKAD